MVVVGTRTRNIDLCAWKNHEVTLKFGGFEARDQEKRSRQDFQMNKKYLKIHEKAWSGQIPQKSPGIGQLQLFPWIFKHYLPIGKASQEGPSWSLVEATDFSSAWRPIWLFVRSSFKHNKCWMSSAMYIKRLDNSESYWCASDKRIIPEWSGESIRSRKNWRWLFNIGWP